MRDRKPNDITPNFQLTHTHQMASHLHLQTLMKFMGAIQISLTILVATTVLGTTACTTGYKIAALDCEKKATEEQRSECRGLKMMSNKQKSVFFIKKSQKELSEDEIMEALNSSVNAVESDPTYGKSHYQKGIAEMNAGNSTKAIESFNQVIKVEPNNIQAYYFKGVMEEELHKYEDALEAFSSAVKINEDFAEAHYRKANLLKDLQQRDEAIKSYKAAYEIWKKKIDNDPNLLDDQPDTKEAFYKSQHYLRSVGAIDKKVYYISYAE